jgi:hypothetical protein
MISGGPVFVIFPTVGRSPTFPIQYFSHFTLLSPPLLPRPVAASNRSNQRHLSPWPDLLSTAAAIPIISGLANGMAVTNTTDASDDLGTVGNYSSSEEAYNFVLNESSVPFSKIFVEFHFCKFCRNLHVNVVFRVDVSSFSMFYKLNWKF